MQEKIRTYTQDGVTAALWSFDSVRIKMRWQAFYREFPIQNGGLNTSVHPFFALFVVSVSALRFEADTPEWAQDFALWWKMHHADIEAGRFKASWETFMELDGDAVLAFINDAYVQTRRDYIPASEEFARDENDAPNDEDFLADEGRVLPTSA